MVSIVENAQTNRVIRDTLVAELAQMGNGSLVSFEVDPQPTYLQIVATVRVPRDLTFEEAKQIEQALAIRLNRSVALKLVEIPVTILDPLVSPTPTPTPTPSPTSTPIPTPPTP